MSSTPAPVSRATPASEPSSSSLDATSTPRVGVIATISDGSWARVRATVTFCWLPPDSSPTGWPGPDDTSASLRVSGAAAVTRRAGLSNPKRSASRFVIVMVTFSATPRWETKPSRWRSSGM